MMTAQTASYLDAIKHVPPGGTLILTDVPWVEFEQILSELGDDVSVRVSYDRGRLEIVSPSSKHEKYKELILRLADTLADELGVDLESFGSTTLKHEAGGRGVEPDTCFYVQHADRVAGKDRIDLGSDPPPDVVVEVDMSRASAGKLAIYAILGVPEVWRYDGRRADIYHLSGESYVEAPASRAFPVLTGEALSRFLGQSNTLKQRAVLRAFREWVRGGSAKE